MILLKIIKESFPMYSYLFFIQLYHPQAHLNLMRQSHQDYCMQFFRRHCFRQFSPTIQHSPVLVRWVTSTCIPSTHLPCHAPLFHYTTAHTSPMQPSPLCYIVPSTVHPSPTVRPCTLILYHESLSYCATLHSSAIDCSTMNLSPIGTHALIYHAHSIRNPSPIVTCTM